MPYYILLYNDLTIYFQKKKIYRHLQFSPSPSEVKINFKLFYQINLRFPIKSSFQNMKIKDDYGNTGCGVSHSGIQNTIDFCLKVMCSKEVLHIF